MKRAALPGAPVQFIAGTRFNADYGWALTLETDGSGSALRLTATSKTREPLVDATFVCGGALHDTAWLHVALVYVPWRADLGGWELFLNGVSQGVAFNRRTPDQPHGSHWFALGGHTAGHASFDGLLDCWRVSEGALAPAQFLYMGFDPGTRFILR